MRSRTTARIGRFGWFVLMLIGVILIVMLYSVKTRALQAKALVRNMEHTVAQEKAGLRILNAEIAHLENPERLRQLAEQHLQLEPVEAERTLTLEEAARQMPRKEPIPESGPEPEAGDRQ
jgi:cell division protein FtsL